MRSTVIAKFCKSSLRFVYKFIVAVIVICNVNLINGAFFTENLSKEILQKHEDLKVLLLSSDSVIILKGKNLIISSINKEKSGKQNPVMTDKKLGEFAKKGYIIIHPLESKRQELIYNHPTKSRYHFIFLFVLVIILPLAVLALFFGKQKVKYRKEIIEIENEQRADIYESNKSNSITISDETTAVILSKLTKFEKTQRYLKKDVSLSGLANYLNTNTKYLTEILKLHKGKKFSDYINGLRIAYITEMLYKNPVYREYKISYLAEECGFASREVFAVVFKKETGISPSYFINNIKKDLDYNKILNQANM